MTMAISPSPLESGKFTGDLSAEIDGISNGLPAISATTAAELPTKLAETTHNPIQYEEEELEAMRNVRTQLIEKHKIDPNRIGLKTLALTTIVTKLRVEEAASKYATYLEMVGACGVASLHDEAVLTMSHEKLKKLQNRLDSYATCGPDSQGRSIMWVKGQKEAYPVEEETEIVTAAIMYHTAIHADALSLRKGITFIIDTSQKPAKKAKNDQKLQKTWQAMPMRPQTMLIAGASLPLRVVINSLIAVASLFTKQKVLDRIKFVKIQDAFDSVPKTSAPAYLGGGGGGIEDIVQWTKQRIDNFPAPNL
eukprot:CAMPEP_0201208482 /NCGR_PEP_ID=MMETSP0851-20130426/176479_1 /ASSEMBLY_ACC=CAM_ASM_000631 /TAXON_ID=183588 /ORGANISM="Pseudo-nitzschia fraudulenta, Strain WWA7" /LENGTH=307 /DNA_ID=CAMNT_0047497035 /DNA_START=196 /DNA_END=1119 /DNA_ORIENTATION=-